MILITVALWNPGALELAAQPAPLSQGTATARIKIDVDRTIGTVIAPIMANKTGVFLPNRPVEPKYLDASSTWNPATREIFVNVVNRSKDRDIVTAIETPDLTRGASPLNIWRINNSDLKATHTYGDDQKVRPVTAIASAQPEVPALTYTFPAHSLTILRFTVR